jgi:cyclophilin family peptidyl-prolyl cis-trans isomerase/HEAT repeat protein
VPAAAAPPAPVLTAAQQESLAVATAAIARAEDRRDWADGTLRHALKHADPAVRARAALAVGRLQDSTTVADLVPLLSDPAAEVRREAIFALGQIGNAVARAPLEQQLESADAESKALAIEALGKLGQKASTPRVAAFLRDASPVLRGDAAVALWRLADSTALDALIERHRDPDAGVRWRVLYALEKIVAPDRVVLIGALHLDDPEWLTRAYSARMMGRQKSPRATAYLLQALADAEPAVVVNAIRGLQLIADTTCGMCVNRLTQALSHPHPYVRVTAALALADRFAWVSTDSVAREAGLDTLAARLADHDAATRGAAARALLARRGAAALPAVEPLLADSSVYARTAVISALDQLPRATAAPLLLRRLEPRSGLFERMTAAEALGNLKAHEAVAALRSGLADSSVLFVASCASALEALGDSASVPALARTYAARAGDADADARIAIRDALRRLAGRAFADSVEHAHPARNASPAAADDREFAAPPAAKGAVLQTTAGEIEWAFYGHEAPQTVKNFVRLAERGYFDGLAIHRVVPNFVIQDGDPTGTGSGGPGYTIRCEYNRLHYEPGMVGMALSGKDTGGSQWFITHSPQLHLDGRYTIFAHVTRGMDVVRRIVQGDRVLKVTILR